MFVFQLWREFKLCIAEILAIFNKWKIVYFDKQILVLDFWSESFEDEILKFANNLGWTIKIIKIIEKSNINDIKNKIWDFVLDKAKNKEWKFKYWINVFWKDLNIKTLLNTTKSFLKQNNISSRFINNDFKNLSSAQILWEKLVNSKSDVNIFNINNDIFIWITIWIQDINSYSKRDWQKDRDMQVWMLPPKLAQIMINLSNWKIIYDPFVWLWTVLIESIFMWNKKVFWSDNSLKMVETTSENIKKLWKNIDKVEIFQQNSKYINEIEIFKNNKIDAIVTEWYLWEIMTEKNISIERIDKQKKSLLDLYNWFFSWLKELNFKWTIIISFPFWEIKWKYFYFNEIYDILTKYCEIIPILSDIELENTKMWSLLYKRDKQLVWREIFKLKIR